MTFYVDASVPVAVRRALAMVRDDIRFAGGPGAPKEKTQDKDWLRVAGDNEWVVIKRDKRIRTRPAEREALIEAGLRTFCMTGGGTTPDGRLCGSLPPVGIGSRKPLTTSQAYIYSVTWDGVRELSLAGVSKP